MRKTLVLFGLAVAGLCGIPSSSQAACCFRIPCLSFCRPFCGPCIPGLVVQIPDTLLRCISQPRVIVPPPVVVPAPPPMPPIPSVLPGPIVSQPVVPPPVVVPPPGAGLPSGAVLATPAVFTPEEFARAFKPVAGKYEVVLIHPGSKKPVQVCFTLPDGCPRVYARNRDLVFDYGRHEVHIRFAIFGKVRVNYR